MATERQSPDALLVQTNLTGSVSDIQDDPDNPDGNWLTADSDNADSDCVVSFPTPTGNPTTGAGLQEFKWWARLTPNGSACNYDIYLLENGTRLNGGSPIASGSLTSTSGQILSATWDASLLGTSDGSLVEAELYVTKTGGAPASRTTGEVGAVEWNVVYDTGQIYNEGITLAHSAGDSRGGFLDALESVALPAIAGDSRGGFLDALESISLSVSAGDALAAGLDFLESLGLDAAAALGVTEILEKGGAITLAASAGITPAAQGNFVALVTLAASSGLALGAGAAISRGITLDAGAAISQAGGLRFLESLVLDAIGGLSQEVIREINESLALEVIADQAITAAKEGNVALLLSIMAGMDYAGVIGAGKMYFSAVVFNAMERKRTFERDP